MPTFHGDSDHPGAEQNSVEGTRGRAERERRWTRLLRIGAQANGGSVVAFEQSFKT